MRFFALALFSSALLAAAPERQTITLLATTDMHGNIYPVDYTTGAPAARGLAKIATLVRNIRKENPNNLLVDCGDTIQGTPLEYSYQTYVRTGKGPLGLIPPKPLEHDPMMLAMNRLGYAAMAVGNHEYNFGLKSFNRARTDADFPWLSANTEVSPGGGEKPFQAYIVKTIGGVKIGVIGITTPAVPTWEKPENMGSYRFLPPMEPVKRALAILRDQEHADIVVLAAHAGLGRNPKTGAAEEPFENPVYDIASQVPGLDAIVYGHSHQQEQGERVNGVLLVQPKNWAISLARIDFSLERENGKWKIASKTSRLIPVLETTAADPDILDVARPYEELAERYLATPVASAARELDGTLGRVEDTPLLDAIQAVQLHYAHADVSMASMFNPRVRVPKGAVTVRQIAALYPYDNELYLLDADGRMLKDALENAARYFLSCQNADCASVPLINRNVMGFNADVAEGVEYDIDLTRPEGDRIRDLRWHGKPVDPGQKLRLAINNYRAAGSGGYSMFKGAKILWHSGDEIRELMVRFYTEQKELPVTADNNWHIIPDAARRNLERQATAEAARGDAQH